MRFKFWSISTLHTRNHSAIFLLLISVYLHSPWLYIIYIDFSKPRFGQRISWWCCLPDNYSFLELCNFGQVYEQILPLIYKSEYRMENEYTYTRYIKCRLLNLKNLWEKNENKVLKRMYLKSHLEKVNLCWLTVSLIVRKTYIIIKYIWNVGNITPKTAFKNVCIYSLCILKNVVNCTSFSVIYYIFHIFQVLIMYKIKRVGIV